MNLLTKAVAAPPTMTSREIAELTGKDHDNVRRDIKALAGELSLRLEEKPIPSAGGRPSLVILLQKRETLILVSGYSVAMRARIIDRWQELEAGVMAKLPQTFAQALKLAADQALQIEQQEAELAVVAPKAAALDLISAGEDDLTITQAAKVLSVKRETLTNWMNANGWVYRQNGSWVAYQQRIANGRLRYKEATYTDDKARQECARPYCHITPKGLTKLAQVFQKDAAPA